ncbi:MAG: CHAT domain-containing protein, partial [Nodosilinea sp.]
MATVRLIIRGQTLENPNSGFRVTLDARDFNHDDREGTLPPLPTSLVEALEAWRSAYGAQEEVRSHCRIAPGAVTRRSIRDINQLAEVLEQNFNTWLRSTDRGWVRIRDLLVSLAPHDPRLLLDCGNHSDLKRLPWQEWEVFIDHYRRADAALRMVNDSRQPLPGYPLPRSARVRILAVVGDCTGINATQDLACVTRLQSNDPKRVEVVSLCQPTPAALQQVLEESVGFHIFIYVGHSRSRDDGQVGWLLLNPQDELSIRDFHRAMGQAIQRGLQLVILNSCDGLGLAQQLANLDLPYCLVMKEPVPDEVAVEFIDRFFRAFLQKHQSLQGAVRQARHGLESFNSRYSQVTWLPTVCMKQNAPPLTWQALLNNKKLPRRTRFGWPMVSVIGYSLTILGLGVVIYLGIYSPKDDQEKLILATPKDLQEKLITDGTNPEFIGLKLSESSSGEDTKRATEEFSRRNYKVAQNLFSQVFKRLQDEKDENPNKGMNPVSPQLLIFSNNACVRQRQLAGQPIYTIVAAGPITDAQGKELSAGTEMLRGIAQVQDEAVKCDLGKKYPTNVPQVNLQVLVAND